MTKELLPELGSGALREALELHEYRNGLCTCGQFVMPHYSYGDLVKFLETHPGRDIRWRYWLDHFSAALSLSSPIEQICRACDDGIPVSITSWGEVWHSTGIRCSKQSTSQASSEIRAKMMASFDKVIPSVEMRVQIVSCILRALKS